MLGSSILVSLASLLVSFVGFANQLVLARLFGASMSMDAYLIAASVPMLLSGILSAALGYSLVPALMVHKSDFAAYRRFSGLLLISLLMVSVLTSAVGFLAAPVQIGLLGDALSSAAKQQAVEIARVSWMATGVILIVDYLRGMHNAARRFLIPIFASMASQIGMILAGLAFGPTYGPLAVAWGMLAGFSLVIPVLLIQTLSELDFSTRCLVQLKDVAGYLYSTPLIMLAMLCFTVFQSVDAYWAPQVGTGSLAYLGYSQRILVALGSLVIVGPAAVMLPRLAEAYAMGRIKDMLHDTRRAVWMVLAFALPVALSVSVLAAPLVRLLFERGEFDHNATQGVAAILPLMMMGMMAMLCVVMVFRALFAKHDAVRASLLGMLAAILYFSLSGLLSQRFGVEGIALAYALTWWLVLFMSALMLWRGYLAMLFCIENLVFGGQLALLAVVMGVVLLAGKQWMITANADTGLLVLQLGVVAASAFAVYFTIAIRMLSIEGVQVVYIFLRSKCEWLMSRLEKISK